MTHRFPLVAALRGALVLMVAGNGSLLAQRVMTAPPAAPAGWTEFSRYFDSTTAASGVVGASAIMVHEGRIVARHDFGLADRSRNQLVTDRTLFHYGSITKTLTAIAIMQLRDRGKLSLDDPIVRWVPELRQVHDAYGAIDSVTIRMLLSHSAR